MRDVSEAVRSPAEFGKSQTLDFYSIPPRKEIDAQKADSPKAHGAGSVGDAACALSSRPLSFAFEARL
jgi:hypothetical protein